MISVFQVLKTFWSCIFYFLWIIIESFLFFFTNITLVCSDSWLTQSDSDRLLEPCPQLRCLMKELRLKSNLSLCRAYTSLREWGGRVKARPAVWLAYSSLLSFYLGRLLAALSRPDSYGVHSPETCGINKDNAVWNNNSQFYSRETTDTSGHNTKET